MAEALLRVDGLEKHFGGIVATDGVTLEVAPGEIHALIGPNGAGKTTLIAQLSGSLAPDAGRILFGGADITAMPQHGRVRAGLARSYQITSIFRRFSVRDNLSLAVQARSGSSLAFWRPVAAETALAEEAGRIAAQVGLGDRLDAAAGSLAHAEQRCLEVGLALATNARLLLLDEPMAGMGPDESQRMIGLIERLRATVSVLLVEHDMDAVFRLADRISVLVNGAIVATGTPAEIRADADVRRAYLGDEVPT
ncbi:MAG: ABC transporter ATP-binding protein [Proteobacteria bacterium]|nr:ABC transporter ATP-binding protein [Pseudomonadota bacterium]